MHVKHTVLKKTKMAESTLDGQEFSERLIQIIEANLQNEQFGVKQLVREMKMSHSSLHRKIKHTTGFSISQFICRVRLKKAREFLKQNTLTISEAAYECGFHSVTYFTKCFRDYYGYSPGEVKKQTEKEKKVAHNLPLLPSKQKRWVIASVLFTALLIVLFFTYEMFNFHVLPENEPLEKTIAVLPFKNDSPDSTNAYFINGLMESILNNLSDIEDLDVRSRTTVEKYRGGSKSLIEIAKELSVNYIVEGSGQKYGDEILLNIQLIEANTCYRCTNPGEGTNVHRPLMQNPYCSGTPLLQPDCWLFSQHFRNTAIQRQHFYPLS